ncbi:phosphopyruvate hydratase [Nanoarchaeota archaeon]
MAKIVKIRGREVLDSRGNPTIEVELSTAKHTVKAMVPSGASTGKHEAVELRDGGKRYSGKGVLKAVNNVNILGRKLKGMSLDQKKIDGVLLNLDGTPNKKKYGANAILGISMAVTRALAVENKIPLYKQIGKLAGNRKFVLPIPAFNIINGGVHAGNNLDFQEYMIWPSAGSFKERLRIGTEVYHELKKILIKKYGKNAANVGDEGGFAPPLSKVEEPIELILKAAKKLGYEKRIKIGLDAAGSEFYKNGDYVLEGKRIDAYDLVDKYKELVKKYPIVSIEDPFAEDDFDTFFVLTKEIGKKVQIVGDDLLVTNPARIENASFVKACNALLLKLNQIGTVTEGIEAAKLAYKKGWKVMVSHRSGETEDDFIADLAVGIGCGQIKSGAPCRSERLAKYNRLLRIEEK